LPVGADATNATEQLYNLLGDDALFDQLQELAERDANADARQVIFDRMQELSNDPDVRRVIEQLNIDSTAEMNPPEATNPADLEPQDPVQEGELDDCDSIGGDDADALIRDVSVPQRDLAEDSLQSIRRAAGLLTEAEIKENVLTDDTRSTLQHIKDTFKRDVKDFETTGEMSQHLHDALFDYYFDDMPYGVQKARDGDPYEWVADRFGSDLGLPGYGSASPGIGPEDDPHLERESVMHGDYAEEAREPHTVDGGMDNPLIQDEETNEADITKFNGEIGAIPGSTNSGPKFNGQIGAGASQGPVFRTDATTGQHVDVSKVVPGEWGSVGNPGYKTAPGTPTFKDMGTAVPANPTALPKPAGGGSSGSAMDLPKGMLGGPNTPVNEKESPLAGKYGHSGKMKPVDKDLSFLDRLKELSGMKK
jgi:hypothetical protein